MSAMGGKRTFPQHRSRGGSGPLPVRAPTAGLDAADFYVGLQLGLRRSATRLRTPVPALAIALGAPHDR